MQLYSKYIANGIGKYFGLYGRPQVRPPATNSPILRSKLGPNVRPTLALWSLFVGGVLTFGGALLECSWDLGHLYLPKASTWRIKGTPVTSRDIG